jgi:hypothetical protein
MEHRMDFGFLRQIHLIRHWVYTTSNAIRPKVAKCQFMVGAVSDRRLSIWLELDENLITQVECPERSLLIGLGLHVLSSMMNVLLQNLLHCLALLEPFFQCSDEQV